MEPVQFSDDFALLVHSTDNQPSYMDGVLIDGCYYTFEELIDTDTAPLEQATLPDSNITPMERPTAEVAVAEVVVAEAEEAMDE